MSEHEPTWAEAMARVKAAVGASDAQHIHAAECIRIREAMATTQEESRSMGYWGNEVLETHRQCCALQSWYDPKKRMYRWFRPQDGWRKP